MSIALIEESAKEVRRLAVAGSPLAVGDFRLKKLIPPLEQAGARVPVFGQVAKAMNDVVNGPEAESAARLLSLSTLLNAILYTQGQSGTAGDFASLETFPANGSTTRTSARVLKPLVEALTASGGGRFEVIKSAVERGAFNDLRLIDPAIQALGDSYAELADLVAEKILPGYGPGIVPRLKSTFDLKGKRPDARKLTVMHRLNSAEAKELCKTALDEGSVEVKVAAVGCLGQHEDCLSAVLPLANAKNKEVRAAALQALAAHDRPEITKLFTELVKGKALDILVGPFRALRNRQILGSLLEEGQRVFAEVLKGDADQISRFNEILSCLDQRKELEVESFLLDCFARTDKLNKLKAAKNSILSGAELSVRLTLSLHNLGSAKAVEAVLDKRDELPPAAFSQVLRCALAVWPPEKIFSEFSPLLTDKKGGNKEKAKELQTVIFASQVERVVDSSVQVVSGTSGAPITWDPRWLDVAIKADEPHVVCWLARPGHPGAVKYLLKLPEAKQTYDYSLAVRALARCQYPKVTDYFLEQVTRKTKGAKYFDYELQSLLRTAPLLPAKDLPKLDAFAAKLDEKLVDHFLEAIAPLRTANPPN